ncbi:hypothetical protein NIES593_11345 [Hydrococcus rivularis NIES-593]|uniref:Glycosyltransferase 2-like domain-containing protein n=1 Tax=Hydrococcus rivularis NIES-593 TaxID=1921803 RepID=A0A1U7HHM3_9CYAN|nr:glycosyltransferase family 2 protein [Hydrococcus rivularis]OKH23045.1 hypothetical protein NIES593_11345 [Hydrococcus rivularis NIES-593]
MNNWKPRVSMGIPVYNGENFLREVLDSLLAQTFEDFELIISDNASSDRTEEICRSYAAKDKRIRYHRQEINRGPAWNFNRVFELAQGEYFKWVAHDDIYAPEFLAKCVEVLDRDDSVVLCYAKTKFIDSEGKILKEYDYQIATDSPQPAERYRSLVLVNHRKHAAVEIFGLIRSDALKKTPLLGYYARGDSVLLVRLSLLGRFYEIPEYLFFNRDHSQRSVKEKQVQIARGRTIVAKFLGMGPLPPTEWFDPSRKGKIDFPEWRLFYEYFISVKSFPLAVKEQISCYLYLGYWLFKNWMKLVRDLLIAAEQLVRASYKAQKIIEISLEKRF